MSKIVIPYDGNDLEVNMILGNWRFIKVEIRDDLRIDMKVPVGMKKEMIHKYIEMNRAKILQEYECKKNRNHQALPITLEMEDGKIIYHNGLRLPYLGNMDLLIRIREVPEGEQTKVYLEEGKDGEKILTIRTDNMDQNFIRFCIMRYYKKAAATIVTRCVKEFSEKLNLPYNKIHITNLATNNHLALPKLGYSNLAVKNQTTLWGRCTRKHTLKFDWKLAMLPMEVIQYIIVHELTHTKKMNHSSRFWKEINKVMPEYQECRNWLSKHGKEYEIF